MLNDNERKIRNEFHTLLNKSAIEANKDNFNNAKEIIKKLYNIPINIINNIDLEKAITYSMIKKLSIKKLDDAVLQAIIDVDREIDAKANKLHIFLESSQNIEDFIKLCINTNTVDTKDKRAIDKLNTLFIVCKTHYDFYYGFAASIFIDAPAETIAESEPTEKEETPINTAEQETVEETVTDVDDAEKELAEIISKYGVDKIKDLLNLKVAIKAPIVDNTNEEAQKIFDNFFGEPDINITNLNWLKRDIVHKAQKAQRGTVKDCIAFINYFMTESAITTLIFKKWRRDVEYTPLVKRVCELVINHLCLNKVLQPYYKNNKKIPENLVGFTLRPELMSEFYLKGNNEGLLYQTQDIKPTYYILTKDKVVKRDTWQEMPISQAYLNGLANMHYLNKITIDGNSYDNIAM